jgi:hypothetical protein
MERGYLAGKHKAPRERLLAAKEALRRHEAETGEITAAELKVARRLWPRRPPSKSSLR